MKRMIKMIGLMAVAAMAVAALVGPATASAINFQAETYPATLKGEDINTHVFTVEQGTVSCATATYEATLAAAAESVESTAA